MSRRAFLKSLTALAGGFVLPAAHARTSREAWKIVQTFPVAGFQCHSGEALWPQLAAGQPLMLMREADNPYDPRAVRVDWQGYKLGFIPRLETLPSRNCWTVVKRWVRQLRSWRTPAIRGTGLRWR